ncbi:MAG: major capsid protein [Microviridae sp.]|nr:MAG: major capsid protein [Microviridae sp.]
MARQNQAPVSFNKSIRTDRTTAVTSGRAGKIYPVDYIPLLRGDSLSGSVAIDINLAEMPKPVLNAVVLNVQAWFVPKSAHPQFSGYDEFVHSYQSENIKSLGVSGEESRAAPPLFFQDTVLDSAILESDFFKTLGVHLLPTIDYQVDLIDAYNLIVNFRKSAYTDRLPRRPYFSENPANATSLSRAFWPKGRHSSWVPDYERALILGDLALDIAAGQIPVSGIGVGVGAASGSVSVQETDNGTVTFDNHWFGNDVKVEKHPDGGPNIFAEMGGQPVSTFLADIDKARVAQSFAKLRSSYAGNDATGFDNADALVAELMQGFSVPSDLFKRPWLLDAKMQPFGWSERFATDAANLDQSVTQGMISTTLNLNVPKQDTGGVIVVTVEVVPEYILEAASDEWFYARDANHLPDALRDVQRTEPVDNVTNRRMDARHSTPNALYGYEPMNAQWNREFTRLGGKFYNPDPLDPFTESRSSLWLSGVVNPTFGAEHYHCPANLPHDVFSDTLADAWEAVIRHDAKIVGLTQIGDVLVENNDDYAAVTAENE